MRGSAKGREPRAVSAWKKLQVESGIEPEYRALQRSERNALLDGLYAEQTGQCVYCGRRISLDQPNNYQVEHFRPQSGYRQLQLEHTNLFLSCKSQSEDGTGQICGDHKANWFDENCHVPPAPESCVKRFHFRSSGDITGDGSPEAEKMIQVLNLNHPELVTNRQLLIESLDQNLWEGVSEEDLLQSYMNLDRNGARLSFAHVVMRILK